MLFVSGTVPTKFLRGKLMAKVNTGEELDC